MEGLMVVTVEPQFGSQTVEETEGACSRHYEGDGNEDEYHSGDVAQGERLAQKKDAQHNGRDGFEGSENGGGGGAYLLDGSRGAQERDEGREDCESCDVKPQVPVLCRGDEEFPFPEEASRKEKHAEDEHAEGESERRYVAQGTPRGAHDIEGIAERRGHDQHRAPETERGTVFSFI